MSDEDRPVGTPISSALNAFLDREGLLEMGRQELCAMIWSRVAGEWYGQHSHVTSVRDGVLYVRCDSAPRAQQLQLDAPEIMGRVNDELGEQYVREIRPSSAGVGRRRAPPEVREPEEPDLPGEQELAQIDVPPEQVREIVDRVRELPDAARERVRELMMMQARLHTWRREHGYVRCPGCGAWHRDSPRYCMVCRPPEPPSNAGGEEGLSDFFNPD